MRISSGTTALPPPTQRQDQDTDVSSHLAKCEIMIAGSHLAIELMNNVVEVTVENSMFMPDSCTIRVSDPELQHVDNDIFNLGKEVKVKMGTANNNVDTVFEGEIVGFDGDMASHGLASFTVRCLNKAHRLHRDRKRQSFKDSKVGDIVGKIAGQNGVSHDSDDVPCVHEYILQNNQTDWEFLRDLADSHGCRLYMSGSNVLKLKKVDKHPSATTVEWGESLRSFRPRLTSAGQVSEVIVRGWDPKTKKEIVGRSTAVKGDHETNIGGSGGDKSKQAFGAAKQVIVDRPIHDQGQADTMAQSVMDMRGTRFIEADGLCEGKATIKAGTQVEVKTVGTRFNGKYNVTATVHTFTPAEGYTTQFICSGKDPSTLLSLIDGEQRDRAAIGGNIVIGIVTNNNDERETTARVKVKFPWLDDSIESAWCRIATPMAGNGRGFMFMPEIDDEVLVAFEHGDVTRPFIIGALWNGKDKPAEPNTDAVKNGKVEQRLIKTRVGHVVMLDDSSDKCHVEVKTKDGHLVRLDDANGKIEVIDKTGSNKMTITSASNSIKLECGGNYDVDAKGKVTIKGAQGILIDSPMNVDVQGLKTTIKGNTEATITGAKVTVAGTGMVDISGALVKIN